VNGLKLNYDAGSYRDRNGRVFYEGDSVYRGISARALQNFELLAKTRFFRDALSERKIVGTERVEDQVGIRHGGASSWAAVLRHQRIPFISYPYEWSFGMLKDAALLELDLMAAALEDDFILKDGSAYNVQWLGARPTFIDLPSWERLSAGEAWSGYRQFCQTLLFPLILQSYKKAPFHPWLRGSLEGIDPQHIGDLMSWRDLFRPGIFWHVYLHAKFQSRLGASSRPIASDLRSAGFHKTMIQANVRKLRRLVQRLDWAPPPSGWSDYGSTNGYSGSDQLTKEAFVRSVVSQRRRQLVWDLGANTGQYARIAAENSNYVLALDADHGAVEHLYQSLKCGTCDNVLPLVGNLVDASPNLGWRGAERKQLIERGRPDLVLCLALIHHVVIGANVPLEEFVRWVADICSELVIEFVHKDDPMVQTLLRNKRDDYDDYEISAFHRLMGQTFHMVQSRTLGCGTRTLYHCVAKS
jgi:hypothetical protein